MRNKLWIAAAALGGVYLLRPSSEQVIRQITDVEPLVSRLGPLRKTGYSNAAASAAESLVGLASEHDNRGLEVDEICRIMGRPQSGDGSPWCAKFASAVVIFASAISRNADPLQRFEPSGSAAALWIDNVPTGACAGVERSQLRSNPWGVRGAVIVRGRVSQDAGNRERILSGHRTQGHALIGFDQHFDDRGRLVIDCVAGNTRGVVNGRTRYSMVWFERIVEGDAAWDRLVGAVYPNRPGGRHG
jgi:hypothetical protein